MHRQSSRHLLGFLKPLIGSVSNNDKFGCSRRLPISRIDGVIAADPAINQKCDVRRHQPRSWRAPLALASLSVSIV
jgi:hypothetical protein